MSMLLPSTVRLKWCTNSSDGITLLPLKKAPHLRRFFYGLFMIFYRLLLTAMSMALIVAEWLSGGLRLFFMAKLQLLLHQGIQYSQRIVILAGRVQSVERQYRRFQSRYAIGP